MPPSSRPPATGGPALREFHDAPFSRRQGLAHESADRLRGPAYRRLLRGAYVSSSTTVTHGRMVQAARLVLPAEAVLAGRSAAWAFGVRWAEPADPVEVLLPASRRVRSRPELAVRGALLPVDEVVATRFFGRVTSPARTAFDLARVPPEEVALGWVDALLRQTRTAPTAALAVAAQHSGSRGVRRARTVLGLADPRAESPRESRLRLLLHRAGLPAPVRQYEVADTDGRVLARLDLAWPELQVAVEYDGAHHLDPYRHRRDLHRHNELRARGWVVLKVDAAQVADPERLLDLVRRTPAARATAAAPRRAG